MSFMHIFYFYTFLISLFRNNFEELFFLNKEFESKRPKIYTVNVKLMISNEKTVKKNNFMKIYI
jgi:hypothetical protein